jgi:hypothetical protein
MKFLIVQLFQPPIISSPLGQDIIRGTLFANAQSMFLLLERPSSNSYRNAGHFIEINSVTLIIQDVPGGMCQTSGGCSLC